MTPWVSTPLVGGPVQVLGASELEPTIDGLLPHRLPARARAQLPDGFARMCEEQPSGVRLVFRTAARRLELDVRAVRTVMSGRPVPPGGLYDVVVDGECVAQGTASGHGLLELDPLTRTTKSRRGPASTVVFPMLAAGEKDVEIWLPFAEITWLLALRSELPITATSESSPRRRWVHHGSSISHGAGAPAPTGTWPVVAARRGGWDLVNLGFSGNAVLDPFTARAIRDQPADLITLKLGINVVNLDCFRLRSFVPAVHGFLDTIREGHPGTPILVISPIVCPLVEDCPGPTSIDPASPPAAPLFQTDGRREEVADGKLSLTVVRQVLAEVVARRRIGDANLGYLDGRDLFGPGDLETMPLPDLLHPGPSGHRAIGARFAAMLPALAPDLVPA
jgi:GDSL-like Lipase/Acylhydrolase family